MSLVKQFALLGIEDQFPDFKKTVISTVRSIRSVNKLNQHFRLPIDIPDILHANDSQTIFILGSGQSVNDISASEWQHISLHKSVAFNVFFVHEFVPSWYLMQVPMKYDNVFAAMFERRIDDYLKTPIIFRGDSVNNYSVLNSALLKLCLRSEEFRFAAEWFVESKSKLLPDTYLNLMYKGGYFSPKHNMPVIFKYGSTLNMLIPFCLQLGFKKIVLVGIDMCDNGHFYDLPSYHLAHPELNEFTVVYKNRGAVNPHMDVNLRPFTVKDIVIAMNAFAKKNFSAEVQVAKKSSRLFPALSLYEFS